MGKGDAAAQGLKNKGTGEVVYLYCFARSALLPGIAAKGVDGRDAPVSRRFLDVAAVVSVIPSDEFCGPTAETRLEDLSWVGPRACRHEKVVEEVMRCSAVFPVRFGTIFSSLERLDRVLERHHDSISEFLDRVAEQEEWGVKAFVNRGKAEEELFRTAVSARTEQLATSSPGMRYLQERRIRADAEKELKVWLREVCEATAEDLNDYTSERCERKVFPIEADEGDMVLNWAFLVPRSAVTEFRARIDRASAEQAKRGLIFQISGPWPPYSFCPTLDAGREP